MPLYYRRNPWADASVFTDNFNSGIDTTNNWIVSSYNGSVTSQPPLFPDFTSACARLSCAYTVPFDNAARVSAELKKTGFNSSVFSTSNSYRVEVKMRLETLINNTVSNAASIAGLNIKDSFNGQNNFVTNVGYKVGFLRISGVYKLCFISRISGFSPIGTVYELQNVNLNQWYSVRIDLFQNATTDTVRVYIENDLNTNNWSLLTEKQYSTGNIEKATGNSTFLSNIGQYVTTNPAQSTACFDDFKIYIMPSPISVPSP